MTHFQFRATGLRKRLLCERPHKHRATAEPTIPDRRLSALLGVSSEQLVDESGERVRMTVISGRAEPHGIDVTGNDPDCLRAEHVGREGIANVHALGRDRVERGEGQLEDSAVWLAETEQLGVEYACDSR